MNLNKQEMPELVHGETMVGDVRIVYQISGDGLPLVCCHAFSCDHTMWDHHRARFSQTHRMITFDQRGSGDSDHPVWKDGIDNPYTIEAFAEDVRGVMDELGIEKARILGFSMGAATALRFATLWPERVERLVVASAMASRLPEEIISRSKKVEEVLAREGVEETYRFYFKDNPLFKDVKKDMTGGVMVYAKKATAHGFLGSFRVTIDRPSLVDELHRIQAPTLVIVGERDKHYLADAELMSNTIPNARKVVLENAGHALNAQVPRVFEDEVMKFLE